LTERGVLFFIRSGFTELNRRRIRFRIGWLAAKEKVYGRVKSGIGRGGSAEKDRRGGRPWGLAASRALQGMAAGQWLVGRKTLFLRPVPV
jgi:hypothetical protein